MKDVRWAGNICFNIQGVGYKVCLHRQMLPSNSFELLHEHLFQTHSRQFKHAFNPFQNVMAQSNVFDDVIRLPNLCRGQGWSEFDRVKASTCA